MQVLSLAWRESRSARRRLLLSMSSITLGVAVLVAIDSLASNATQGVHDQARSLVGGDVAMSPRDSVPTNIRNTLDSLKTLGAGVGYQTTLMSMASGGPESRLRLVQMRAVSPEFPFYGGVRTEPASAWAQLHDGANAVVDVSLLTSLGAHVGDSISLGDLYFKVTGIVRDVASDVAISTTLGPRVYVPARFLPATNLIKTGSLSQQSIVLRLPPSISEESFANRFGMRFGRQGVRIRTAEQNADRVSETIGYLRNFLAIVGLIALMLGGIGVASGVRAFVLRKIDTVAILRCLGATGAQVLFIYVTQAAALGLVGAAIGAALGVVLQFALGSVAGRFLPAGLEIGLAPQPIAFGILTGVWVALVCALQPLLALRRVSPLQALRREEDSVALGRHADWPARFVAIATVASLVFVTIARARRWQEGVAFAAAILLVIGALWLAATLLSIVARRSAQPTWPFALRHGVASLHRPGNQTRAVIIALGFGVFLVSTLYETQASLLTVTEQRLAELHANVVFFDIQQAQAPVVDSLLKAHRAPVLTRIPILTVRIATVNGDVPKNRRAVGREWRASYADTMSSAESVVSGKWFGKSAGGEVSLDSTAAIRIGAELGDSIVWTVQGISIPTRLTSLRTVDRSQLQPSFQVMFPPSLVRDAPAQFVMLAEAMPDSIPQIQKLVVDRFSNISTVDLSLVEATITAVLTKIHSAIRGLTLLCILLAVPVIFSAVAATRRERLREAVLLKVLGASRRQVVRMLFTEYAVIGTLGALAGLLLSALASWALAHFIFSIPLVGAVLPALGIGALMIAVVVVIGLLTGREVFMSTPMAALRE